MIQINIILDSTDSKFDNVEKTKDQINMSKFDVLKKYNQ